MRQARSHRKLSCPNEIARKADQKARMCPESGDGQQGGFGGGYGGGQQFGGGFQGNKSCYVSFLPREVWDRQLISRPAVVLATSPETAHPVVVEVDSDLTAVPEDSVAPRSAT